MTFDPNWPHGHVTRDGRKARIICADRKGDAPILALVTQSHGEEYVFAYRPDGQWHSRGAHLNLLNAPPPPAPWPPRLKTTAQQRANLRFNLSMLGGISSGPWRDVLDDIDTLIRGADNYPTHEQVRGA